MHLCYLGAGVDTAVVTNQLGHTEIATTEKYYHYDIEDDAEKIQTDKRHNRNLDLRGHIEGQMTISRQNKKQLETP